MQEKLKRADLDDKERIKLELEIEEVKRQEEDYLKKEKELEEKEKLEPWNVDTIGHEAFSKSVFKFLNPLVLKCPVLNKFSHQLSSGAVLILLSRRVSVFPVVG